MMFLIRNIFVILSLYVCTAVNNLILRKPKFVRNVCVHRLEYNLLSTLICALIPFCRFEGSSTVKLDILHHLKLISDVSFVCNALVLSQ